MPCRCRGDYYQPKHGNLDDNNPPKCESNINFSNKGLTLTLDITNTDIFTELTQIALDAIEAVGDPAIKVRLQRKICELIPVED